MSHFNHQKRSRLEILLESQNRRQKILDWLHSDGPKSTEQIALYLEMDQKKVSTTICEMYRREELGKIGNVHKVRWIAVATTTVSAETRLAHIHASRVDLNAAKKKIVREPIPEKLDTWVNGKLTHIGGKTLASNAGTGGQGALRPRVYVNCQQFY